MMLIDTHTHLYSEDFASDRMDMIQRAIDQNVQQFFVPAIDRSYFEAMVNVKNQFPNHIHLMMGLHPCYVKPESYKEELAFVKSELDTLQYVAVGEIGVDLFWDKSTLAIQQEAFQTQIQWSKEFDLPINIHCRDAFEETFEVLEQERKDLSGIFHCFTGGIVEAKRAIDLGLKLGIGGVVTFKNGKIDQFLNEIPLEHIVLETDSPYLAPVPYRGKRNESAYVNLVAEKLASIYQLTPAEIAEHTSKNALEVFKKSVNS